MPNSDYHHYDVCKQSSMMYEIAEGDSAAE